MKHILNVFLCVALLLACDNPVTPEGPAPVDPQPPVEETPGTPQITHSGLLYVWDESVIPEITVHITKDEWNALLKRYDEDNHTVDYFHADFTFKKGDDVFFIEDGGLRLRGNTSRRRPEGNAGQMHQTNKAD